ncbi:hypothetical protein [Rhizobium indigoferae]|uniref:Uncharacterized protein n=1 Tax=Rhizobium indigoferae TaxID=158891 RepID=A0ABZ1DQC6_9HYPH|nr:hypothetical protein [Rhizobium indigoferae]WRW38399.1 hypothetical protein U5G49_005416 [Rhizobium indigoferae]
MAQIPNKAIATLADLAPMTNGGENIQPSATAHADAAVGFQPSAA